MKKVSDIGPFCIVDTETHLKPEPATIEKYNNIFTICQYV